MIDQLERFIGASSGDDWKEELCQNMLSTFLGCDRGKGLEGPVVRTYWMSFYVPILVLNFGSIF